MERILLPFTTNPDEIACFKAPVAQKLARFLCELAGFAQP